MRELRQREHRGSAISSKSKRGNEDTSMWIHDLSKIIAKYIAGDTALGS